MSETDVSPREQRVAFHRRHVKYHETAAADHNQRGELDAAWRHQAATHAHEALTDGRNDQQAEDTAFRLSGMAEQASYQAKSNRSA